MRNSLTIISLSEKLEAPIVSLVFAAVWAAKASSIDLLYIATTGVCFFGNFLASIDGICYIYNIRREAHLHLKGRFFSPIANPCFCCSFSLFSNPPLFFAIAREGHNSFGIQWEKGPLSVWKCM